MTMSKAGKFDIEVWKGGYPVWCVLKYDGKEAARLHHRELRDLEYVAQQAMREARAALGESHHPCDPNHRYSDEV